MIIKTVLAKKIAATLLLNGLAFADARTMRQVKHGRELNPIVRPFVNSRAAYAVIESDALAATVLLWKRPSSRLARSLVPAVIAGHAVGVGFNLHARAVELRKPVCSARVINSEFVLNCR